jgi:hypothetical protein
MYSYSTRSFEPARKTARRGIAGNVMSLVYDPIHLVAATNQIRLSKFRN